MSDAGGDSGGGGGGGGENNNEYSNDNDNHDNGNHDDGWRNNQHDYNNNNSQYYNDRQSSGKCCGRDWATIPFGVKVLIAFFPLAIGLGAGFGTLANSMMKNSSWISVKGEVVGLSDCGCSSSNNNNSYSSCSRTYAAIVEYIVDGITYSFTSSSCSSPAPTIGNDYKVLYDPSDPGSGVSGGFVALWLMPIIFIAIGLGGLALMCTTCYKKVAGSTPEVENTFGNDNTTNAYDDGKVETFAASTYVDPPPTAPYNSTPATYVADEVPTNPYVTYAEENNIGTNTNTNTKPGNKPSYFDQMAGGAA
jgi:hypothetical protein